MSWLSFLPQGHAAPALYSMWVEAGFLKESELLSLCHVDSTLEGHQTPVSFHILSHTLGIISWSTQTVYHLLLYCVFVCCVYFRSSNLWIWPLAPWDRVLVWPVEWLTLGSTLTSPGNVSYMWTHTHKKKKKTSLAIWAFCLSWLGLFEILIVTSFNIQWQYSQHYGVWFGVFLVS